MTSSSPIDAPVSLICEQRRRKLPSGGNTPTLSSKSETPSPKPTTNQMVANGLPPPVPLSASTPQSKSCCQSAANSGQPFCPTCYVTAILASYKQQQQQQLATNGQQKTNKAANSSNSDNGSSTSSATPERRPLSPPDQPPMAAAGPVDMLSFLQQTALKQRLEPPFLINNPGADRGQQSSPSSIGAAPPTPQELFFQSLLAGHLPAPGPGSFGADNLQLLAAARAGHIAAPVAPPQFFINPAEAGGPLMNPYGPYGGAAFDLNGMRRKNATRETTAVLKQWLAGHRKNPYPTKGEKIMLAIISKMTLTQVSTWFANARRRLKKENKGNATWNSGGGGDQNDGGAGSGSNDDGDTVDDVELQVEDSNSDNNNNSDAGDELQVPDDDDEPPQRRQRFEEPVSASSPRPPVLQQAPTQPNPVLAASIAALLEAQQNHVSTPQPPVNPFANLLQQIYGDRLNTILQLQQQAAAVRPNLLASSAIIGAQLPSPQSATNENTTKNMVKKPTSIWSIAAEITSPNNVSQN